MNDDDPMDETARRRRLLTVAEVMKITGRSRSSLWRDAKEGRFPCPVRVGRRANRYYEDEVYGWMANRPRAG